MPGRIPKPDNARARQNKIKPGLFKELPRTCELPLPEWPFPYREPSPNEFDLWATLWAKGQANEWHGLGFDEEVARYVIMVIEDLDGTLKGSTARSEIRQMADRLGLSPLAMQRLFWKIEGEPEPEEEQETKSVRDRGIMAVDE